MSTVFQIPPIARLDADTINETIRKIQVKFDEIDRRLDTRAGIIAPYEHGRCYQAGDLVRVDSSYTMQYLQASCESPRIQIAGDFEWISGDTDPPSLAWSKSTLSASSKTRGNEYRLLGGRNFLVQQARFYVPHNANTQDYTIFHGHLNTQLAEWTYNIISQNIQSTAEGSYINVPYVGLWKAGQYHRMGVQIRSLGSTAGFSGYWQQKNENGSPGSGEATFQNSQTQIRFHYTDKNDVDHETALRDVPVGATLKRGSTEWQITSVDQRASHVRFDVSPGGQRGSENEYTYTFEYGTAEPLHHAEVDNRWFADPFILGVWANDGDPLQESQDQYMVDIYAAEAYISPDVAVISLD